MNKHICFIIPSIGIGGAERVVSILANYLILKNHKVSIICLINNVEYILDERIDLIFPEFDIPRKLQTLNRVVRYYRKTVREIRPDIILSFLEFYNEITMLSLIGIRKNLYLFDRNNPYLKEQNYLQALLRRILYPAAKGVVVQTEAASRFIRDKKLNSNVLVLPNPVSKIKIDWNSSSNNIITCVGRLEPQKNQKYLIKIFAELPTDGWTLQIVGDGRVKSELELYVKSLGIEEKVKFLGVRKDVQQILSESAIFAFPSLREGFPNALLEAMAVGVPCISNNCNTGPSELIRDGENGFLVEVGNEEEFKKKLLSLMSDPQLREDISQEGRKTRNLYTIDIVAERLLNFISISN